VTTLRPSKPHPTVSIQPPTADSAAQEDLGFGTKVSQQIRTRLLNRDGSFNVARKGLALQRAWNPFHELVTMSWTRFYLLVLGIYVVTNLLFASAFLLCGEGALLGAPGRTTAGRTLDAFFFSVQTLATIGYGRISPEGLAANTLVAIEALVGMMGFALATGLLFARFSRPIAQIIFSRQAVIAPYREITGFMFRIANERTSQLFEVEATVVMSRLEGEPSERVRKFNTLTLERSKVMFFPLHWIVVHPINEASPLFGLTAEQLLESEAEFLVLLTAVDETFSQAVHARSSYKAEEVAVGARFADMFQREGEALTGIDLRRIHDIEPASLPGSTS